MLLSCRQESGREVEKPLEVGVLLAGMPLPLLTQWKACLVAGFLFCGHPWWGQEQSALLRSSGNLVELVQTSPWRPLLSPRKKGHVCGVCPQSFRDYS